MTMLATAFTPYDAKGNREDLSDFIYNIDPTDTPLMAMAGRGKCTATLHEWQTEALSAAVSSNAQLDGDLVTSFTAVTASVRVGNYTQISRKEFAVSGTQEAVNHAGRRSELAHVAVNKMAELKRDIEKTAFENIAGAAGSTTVARKAATLGAWLKTNTDEYGGTGGDPTYTAGVPAAARTDLTQRALTSTIFKAVLSSMFTNGAKTDTVFAGTFNKAAISAISGVATKTIDLTRVAKPALTVDAVDVYVGEYGTLKIVPSRLCRTRDAYFIDREYISFDYLRPFFIVEPKIAFDGTARMIIVEWTLKIANEAAHGLAADLSTS
jgi:Family of unknown function (DUF5309)